MRRPRYLRLAVTAAASVIAFVVGSGPAQAQAPSPGDSCTVLHATTQDADGKTMWRNPTMTGSHSLVWQYGGSA
ncbi:MAG: hypothetical protein K2X97_21800 [Mycobacteriaceae bacterium]|nr:hypothetical protein [Mycobacteriaceae bacterium]